MTRDLTSLMPSPAPQAGRRMFDTWVEHFGALDDVDARGRHTPESTVAEQALTKAIEDTREAVIQVLSELE